VSNPATVTRPETGSTNPAIDLIVLVFPEQADNLARLDRERHAIDRRQLAVAHRDVIDVDERLHRSSSPGTVARGRRVRNPVDRPDERRHPLVVLIALVVVHAVAERDAAMTTRALAARSGAGVRRGPFPS
jgi:hypothetical protein